jgi:thiol-disulfide isomerase/thioredoxin
MSYLDKYLKYKLKYVSLKRSQLNSGKQYGGGDECNCNGECVDEHHNTKTLYLFKANSCSHCQNFLPTWTKISTKGIKNVKFVIYDYDTDLDKINEYKVESFPTIKLKTGDKIIDYNGNRDKESIRKFVIEN